LRLLLMPSGLLWRGKKKRASARMGQKQKPRALALMVEKIKGAARKNSQACAIGK
jgi:hypothetical protein